MERFKLFENVDEICSAFSATDKIEREYLGNLEEKGVIFIFKHAIECNKKFAYR